jgi:uncharacterized protein (DUF1800 family)
MKRLAHASRAAALLVLAAACLGIAAGRFDQKLSADKQVLHVLNRLTFGPRPGDIEQVRRIGVEKWIDQQLHPEQIPENPILESRLQPLDTVRLLTWQIAEKYPPPQAAVPIRLPAIARLNPQLQSRLRNGSLEERRNTLDSLDPETRRSFLASAPPQVLEGFPAQVLQEAAEARKAEQEERQKQILRLMPPLNDLLTQDQVRTARQGSKEEKLALLNSFDLEKRRQILRALGPQPFNDIPDLRREAMAATQPQQLVNEELIESKVYRAVYSNRQLQEVLVDFWMNHFNVFNGKGPGRLLLTSFERDAIRPYVFGHFKDMLLATARHPAMLFYLDNWQSQVPRDDLPGVVALPAAVRQPGLNENYARELMELHTMGVDGGYTQADVIAVARALSGWTIYDQAKYAEFQFNPAGHDRKEKVVLGHVLPAGRGEQDGIDVIDILAHHPSTARFISKKLAQRFVADAPPQTLIDRMAATFRKTDGDLRAVLQTMFNSTEFMSVGAWQSKVKSPLEMVISAVRALNADVVDAYPLAQRIGDLGEPLYGKLEPTGYPNTGEAWINTAGILGRINFATALAAGQVPGVKADLSRFQAEEPAAVAKEILKTAPSAATLEAIEQGIRHSPATPALLTTLVLSSPDFQRR